MAVAFQCDICSRVRTGKPRRIEIHVPHDGPVFEKTEGYRRYRWDVCEHCSDAVRSYMFGKPQDSGPTTTRGDGLTSGQS